MTTALVYSSSMAELMITYPDQSATFEGFCSEGHGASRVSIPLGPSSYSPSCQQCWLLTTWSQGDNHNLFWDQPIFNDWSVQGYKCLAPSSTSGLFHSAMLAPALPYECLRHLLEWLCGPSSPSALLLQLFMCVILDSTPNKHPTRKSQTQSLLPREFYIWQAGSRYTWKDLDQSGMQYFAT